MRILRIVLASLLGCSTATAETLWGRVIGISDGDTITVLVEKRQVKVRINGIDAPEKWQPFAQDSSGAKRRQSSPAEVSSVVSSSVVTI
jgi:endonuclease YncB( thermonuclease family)